MKHEKTSEFSTANISLDEAARMARNTVEMNSVFNTEMKSNSENHIMIESSGNEVSVMQMGSEIRVHASGDQQIVEDVMNEIESVANESPMASEMKTQTSQEDQMAGFRDNDNDPTPDNMMQTGDSGIQASMDLMRDGELQIDKLDESGEIVGIESINTSAGFFIEDDGQLSIGEMYFDESFGMRYDTSHVEQLINELREAMLEEVR